VTSILEVGRLLIEAKAGLVHGEFLAMVEGELPFGVNTADKLMRIARHPVLSNSEHVHNLPPSWGTLYDLSRLPVPLLQQAISDGRITPELSRSDVARLGSTQVEEETLPRCLHCSGNTLVRVRSQPYYDSAHIIGAELYDCRPCGKSYVYNKTFSHETAKRYIA
jgi:DNA-directed RNA polymerase subunit RPC12/RpoP